MLQKQLPADVVEQLDLEGLQVCKDSFVDSKLNMSFSDLVFEVPLLQGGSALVTVLFEHKSSPDLFTPAQVLSYISGITDTRRRNNEAPCCVIPIILYHGESAWPTEALSLLELTAAPNSLRRYVPDFDICLIDLSRTPDDELREKSIYFSVVWMLKYSRTPQIADRLTEALQVVMSLRDEQSPLEVLEAILRYVVSASQHVTPTQLERAVRNGITDQSIQSRVISTMPTLAEAWIQEGHEKGREQGLAEGLEKGKLIGQLQLLQNACGEKVSSDAQLSTLSDDSLQAEITRLLKLLPGQNG